MTAHPAHPAADRWIARLRTAAPARLRLLCVPHVGAGAAAFRPWLAHLPEGVELCAVRAPGRENRLGEPLLTDPRALLDALEPRVAALREVPLVVVGHCSGSVLAYELARRLAAAGAPPHALVLSSAEGPRARVVEDPPLHRLPRAELLARVVKYGGMAAQVLDDADLMAMFERILRADYQLVETLAYSPGAPLDLPLTVIGGLRDEFVAAAAMAAWSTETTRGFTLHLLDAAHYVLEPAGPLMGRIAGELLESGAGR
ncbi:thioesterase II family protein [Actinacidiphila guanduensis]|uniref:Medium-chain acyl-[acyl-carrier-protein] hydrolase n=1 Tax=Actinacidiphila guanduensis TaxID=310781 RepID=A0A1H0BQN4_9ACTN|nr:alpha/beta fold hydrolase [Actinacidiphila guanduensis]SDN47918.1 medium-chain acyl-[acyl-carrier-protein] hydrolase [Actinacidiphila guanduensis]